MTSVALGERSISVADVVAVARHKASVTLSPAVVPRLERARAVVERFASGERAVYGLNTGLGAAVDTALAPDDIALFQRRAVMARAVGVGDFLSTDEVRATLFVRLAGIARGASGLAPDFAEAIRAMLEHGVHPRARRIGTLGEADLAPLAQLFLPLAGAGEAEVDGAVLSGVDAMHRAGIACPAFGPKDGIALLNANAFGIGLAALCHYDAALALEALTAAGALALEGFRANLSPLDPRVTALRQAPGQTAASRRIMGLLAGSDLVDTRNARRVQDPLSFRCLAPVMGATFEALARTEAAISADLNGAGDSPAVLADDMLSTVNFDTTALALAFEGLGLAMAHASSIAVFRILKLMSPTYAELPRFLTRHGGSRTGFATVQKTAAALDAEIRHLALPLSAMTAPVADGAEDYAPMTPRVIEKTRDIVHRLTRLAAVELTVAAQAVDLRDAPQLGAGTRRIHGFVRARVPALDEDRPTGPDFEVLAAAIAAGELRAALAAP
jgi:histidine ammonia-lyase